MKRRRLDEKELSEREELKYILDKPVSKFSLKNFSMAINQSVKPAERNF